MPPLEVTANASLWWAHPDSNREPKDYESPAPPLSYRPVACSRKSLQACTHAKERKFKSTARCKRPTPHTAPSPTGTLLKEKGRNHLIPALSFVVVATGFEPVTPAV